MQVRFARELPPRFGLLQRALDPTLAREDTSRLYNMFRARRRDHPWGPWRTVAAAMAQVAGGVAAIAVVLVLAAFSPLLTLLGVLMLALVAPVVWISTGRLRLRHAVIPRRLGSVYALRGHEPDGAREIWLAGATGREVVEALYLEKREGDAAFHFFVTLVAACAFAGWLASTPEFHPSAPMLGGAGIILSYHLAAFLYMWGGLMTKTQKIDRLVSIWHGERPILRALDRRFWMIASLVPLVWFLQLGYAAILGTILTMESGSIVDSWTIRSAGAAHQAMAMALLMVAVSAVLWFVRRALGGAIEAGMEDTMKRADHAFDRFMAGTVPGDIDGYRWADWRHGARGHARGNEVHQLDLAVGATDRTARMLPPPRIQHADTGSDGIRIP
jgi:hypothetical protein